VRNLQSHSFAKKQRLKKWAIAVLIVIIIATFIISLSEIAHARFLTIQDVNVYGADEAIVSAVHNAVIQELNGNYLRIFPRSNSLIYPKKDIIAKIKKSFPRVLNVTVGRDGFTHLKITVSEKTPKAVVCAMLPDFEGSQLIFGDSDPCYYADQNGYLFERSLPIVDHSYVVYFAPNIHVTGSTSDMVGSFATSTSEFVLLQSMIDAAQGAHIPVDGLLIKDNGEYEMYASSTIIYFNDEEGIASERDNLVTFWKHMTENSNDEPVFDYIKLQYGSNVFYKTIQ
jgi:hypothetical protein